MIILTFVNTHAVIQAERELKTMQIPYQIIPTPRHISTECGMCLKIKNAHMQTVLEHLESKEIVPSRKIESGDDDESKL